MSLLFEGYGALCVFKEMSFRTGRQARRGTCLFRTSNVLWLRIAAYTNSITTRLPTNPAARCNPDSVMSHFGASIRSTCDRLVFSKTAIRALEIFFFFMAAANWDAASCFMGRASTFPKMFSFFKKSATCDPTPFSAHRHVP